jgi:hypothetical protein
LNSVPLYFAGIGNPSLGHASGEDFMEALATALEQMQEDARACKAK